MIQLKDAKNKERIVFISISVMPSSNSCLEIYIITHNPNLHGPVIFGDSLELVPGPRSLFQYHVGRRDSIQCTHMFSLCKNGFFLEIITENTRQYMYFWQKKTYCLSNNQTWLIFFSCMKSLIMCMINKMKMN